MTLHLLRLSGIGKIIMGKITEHPIRTESFEPLRYFPWKLSVASLGVLNHFANNFCCEAALVPFYLNFLPSCVSKQTILNLLFDRNI